MLRGANRAAALTNPQSWLHLPRSGADVGGDWRQTVNLITFNPKPYQHRDKLLHFARDILSRFSLFCIMDRRLDDFTRFLCNLADNIVWLGKFLYRLGGFRVCGGDQITKALHPLLPRGGKLGAKAGDFGVLGFYSVGSLPVPEMLQSPNKFITHLFFFHAAARLLGLVRPKNFRISGAIVAGISFV